MKHQFLVLVAAMALLPLVPAGGQVASLKLKDGKSKNWAAPRTPDGQPDLQGLWSNATLTPFERPKELAGKPFFTEQEAVAFEKRIMEGNNRDRRGESAEADVAGAYNDFWFERGTQVTPSRRTSLVVDPPDGKVPPLTPEAQKAAAEKSKKALQDSGKHRKPVVTTVEAAPTFYLAEDYHQQYLEKRGLASCHLPA